jgi:serine/threonine protein phosphatase PrpC
VRDKVNNDLNCGIFAVFDGHGGKHVADHVAERIPEELRKELVKNPAGDLGPAIEQVFLRVSEAILTKVHRLTTNFAYWTLITLGAQHVSPL